MVAKPASLRIWSENGVWNMRPKIGSASCTVCPVDTSIRSQPTSAKARAITTADQVNTIVAAGRADLVALARPHLVDPFFTLKAAAWYGATDIHCPPQYLSGRDQIFRNAARDRAELTELKRRKKPK